MLGEVNQNAFAERITIDVDTVDNILAELGFDRVDYAEITVNGAELQVLEGMQKTLANTKRVFVSGYARTISGKPMNRRTEAMLRALGLRTKITTRAEPTQAGFDTRAVEHWGRQEGHVFAWRE